MYRIKERELWEYQYLEQAVMEAPDMEIKTLFRDHRTRPIRPASRGCRTR